MKSLKFRERLSRLILNGEKTSTWRFFDDKNISKGDIVSMIVFETGKEFAKAKVINVQEKEFGKLTSADKEGNEKFSSDKEMYEIHSEYYKTKITPKTKVKIIKFELIR